MTTAAPIAFTPAIRLLAPEDRPALLELNERAFGPGRFARTAYRIREGASSDERLDLCIMDRGKMIGAVQFTPIAIGDVPGALLLGPLVIDNAHKNRGWGLKLMLEGMDRARRLGYRLVLLVGDLPYYSRAGFSRVPAGRITLPGPVDPARILYAELVPGALDSYGGAVRGLPRP